MANNFQSGHLLPASFKLTGAGAHTVLNITGWNFDEEALLHLVTHTASGGGQARIAGPEDLKGEVTYDVDLDILPHGAPGIVAGAKGMIRFYVSSLVGGKYYEAPVIIEKVHWQSAVQGKLEGSFSVMLEAHSGTRTRPI